jgi:cell division protease FtsH
MQTTQNRDYSDAKAEEIDKEVYRLVTGGYEKAKDILRQNIAILHSMAEALLEHETIDSDEVDLLIRGGRLEEINRRREERRIRVENERRATAESLELQRPRVDEKKVTGGGRDPMGQPGPVTA